MRRKRQNYAFRSRRNHRRVDGHHDPLGLFQQAFQLNTGHGTIPQCSTCQLAAKDDPDASFPCEECPFPLPEQYYPAYRTLIDVAEVTEAPNPENTEEPFRFLKIDPAWLSLAIQARRLSPQDFDLCLYVRRFVNAG